ncbi:MAG: FtsX-like permease family protein [Bacteroidota bacterium]
MYLNFAWRYFKAKKSANAINIIAWVTTGVIAFATCCQVLVMSVYNGFEDLVKSLYSSFYTDLKVIPVSGKTFFLDPDKINQLKKINQIESISFIAEEKALLQNGDFQSVVQLKGVDENFTKVSGVPAKMIKGNFELGTASQPLLVVGSGIQNASGIILSNAYGQEDIALILPKSNVTDNDPLQSLSEGIVTPSGVFSIQQEFDNAYALTNIDFVKQQTGLKQNEFTAAEIKLKKTEEAASAEIAIKKILGNSVSVQNRYQQNANLYSTMATEKWVIYAVLTLILIIAAFNMISALTMLVLEKKQDIAILQSMGATKIQIKKIFLSEGLLLGSIGTLIGVFTATLICYLQVKFKLIKLQGGSFLIDYFPVKFMVQDFIIVIFTAMAIVLLASWLPSAKAANQPIELK